MENLEIEVNDDDDEALAVEADIQVTCITVCRLLMKMLWNYLTAALLTRCSTVLLIFDIDTGCWLFVATDINIELNKYLFQYGTSMSKL